MTATVSLPLLATARIASPCPMKWDELTPTGEDAMRHCEACGLNVYNLADMTADQAEALLRRHAATGERLCGALWRRADGTIITKNCPVGWRAARQRAIRAASRLAAAAGLLVTGGLLLGGQRDGRWGGLARVRSIEPFRSVSEWISPSPPPARGQVTLGAICPAPSTTTVPSQATGNAAGGGTGGTH